MNAVQPPEHDRQLYIRLDDTSSTLGWMPARERHGTIVVRYGTTASRRVSNEGIMRHVHFIARKYQGVRKVGPGEWESGDWYASDRHAWEGARIYLHDAKALASYLGGEIISFRKVKTGPAAGRLVFRFREDPKSTGVTTARCTGRWAQEKKYCR